MRFAMFRGAWWVFVLAVAACPPGGWPARTCAAGDTRSLDSYMREHAEAAKPDPDGSVIRLYLTEDRTFSVTDEVLRQVSALPTLQELSLQYGKGRKFSVQALADCLRKTRVPLVKIACHASVDAELLAAIVACDTVTGVSLGYADGVKDDVATRLLRKKKLSYLSLAGAEVGPEVAAAVNEATDLTELILDRTKINDGFIYRLKPTSGIRSLSVAGCRLSGKAVASLSKMASLEKLNASHIKLGRDDLVALAAAEKLAQIRLAAGDAELDDAIAATKGRDHPRILLDMTLVRNGTLSNIR